MKRFLSLICLLGLALLLPAAALVSNGLPADTRAYVEKKYAGWNGVLRAWVCAKWSCSGSFTRWLNACAAEFEKHHEGVYIEFTPVSSETLCNLSGSGMRPPELVLFSPGAWTCTTELSPIAAPDVLRDDLRDCGGGCALPVAMGGYIWVYNRTLCTDMPAEASVVLPDDGARSFTAALTALLSENPDSDGRMEGEPAPDPGLDLGLPAIAAANADVPIASEDALDRFIAGELSALPVTQKELARLIQLRSAGRGPDWACAETGSCAYTDQLLLLSIVRQTDAEGPEREALASEFARMLLSQDAQSRLSDIGAFSVTGLPIYANFSAYAPLDALLCGRRLIVPDPFADASSRDCSGILRDLCAGRLNSEDAVNRLEWTASLQFQQNSG